MDLELKILKEELKNAEKGINSEKYGSLKVNIRETEKYKQLIKTEIEKIMGQIKDGVVQSKSVISYSIGEKVQVIDGPFASFTGLVEEVEEEKLRLKVAVSIFGRPTPVELEFNQVEKVS